MHSERRVCPGVLHTKPPCLACLDRICGPYIGPICCLSPPAKSTRPSLQITHDDKGETSVTSLEYVDVSQPELVAGLLERAMRQRSVGATAMNEQSSRSHMVFMLHIDGTNKETGQRAKGGYRPWLPVALEGCRAGGQACCMCLQLPRLSGGQHSARANDQTLALCSQPNPGEPSLKSCCCCCCPSCCRAPQPDRPGRQ